MSNTHKMMGNRDMLLFRKKFMGRVDQLSENDALTIEKFIVRFSYSNNVSWPLCWILELKGELGTSLKKKQMKRLREIK
jgi:hypothetical protein